MTFRKDWIEELVCPKWCRAVESSLGIRKQESCLDEQERNKSMDIFGKKRISELELALEKSNKERNEYKLLSDTYNNTIEQLNDDVKKLTDEINAKVENCTVGAWCEGCKYCKTARLANNEEHKNFAKVRTFLFSGSLYDYYYYCSKHLREICPEFEKE